MRRRESTLLKNASLDSIVLAIDHFNRAVGPARLEASVIFAQRALELLLKATINEETGRIRGAGEPHTYSFRRCLNIAVDQLQVLSSEERISLRALESDRDAATHHLIQADEPFLYIKIQSAVTIYAKLLEAEFEELLTARLPLRALPVSAQPPSSLTEAMDTEIVAIKALLAPKRRQSAEARARLRSLLNLEAAAWGREPPTEKELERAQRSIRDGKGWRTVFPGVATLEIESEPGEDRLPMVVRLTRSEGPAVRRAKSGEEALLYREVNPFDRWPFKPTEAAALAGLSTWRAWALIEHLGLKDDEKYFKEVSIGGGQVIQRYSQSAVDRLREAQDETDMDAVWETYQKRHKVGQKAG